MFGLSILNDPWLGALTIFFLRVVDMTLDTLRVLYVMRGRRNIAWILGFLQSAVFVIAITSVLSNLDNPLNIVGYAAGFATGNVIGMVIEEKLAVGFTHVQIISSRRGVVLAQGLRDNGFAVTEIPARGKDGMVSLLNLSVRRKQVFAVETIVNDFDNGTFMTVEEVRPMRRGFWRA
jgi:uncharacterized protein YebE (UPF0316 family)